MNYYKRHLGDYAKNTRTLSTYEHGAYNLILDLYYTDEAPVSTDDAYAICRADAPKDRQAVDRVLAKFFRREGDVWRHSRADEEIAEYQKRAERNRDVGQRGGRPAKKETQQEPNGNPLGFQTEPETEPNGNPDGFQEGTQGVSEKNPSHKPLAISQEKEKTQRAPTALELLRAEGVPDDLASEFLTVRKAKKAPLTPTALLGIKREAGKSGRPVSDAIRICVERGWQSFNAEWVGVPLNGATSTTTTLLPDDL